MLKHCHDWTYLHERHLNIKKKTVTRSENNAIAYDLLTH